MLTSIKTGNAITTALVIAMFIYLFVKLNIKFIIRQFTIIIFTIFTPVAVGLWIINRNVTAAMIWSGQIIMNIFMQFIYCFLFLIYLAFLPSGGGWAVSLIWAMMILPLADALQNCLQDLTSRIAGVDNEMMTNRGLGMGAAIGYSLGTIKEQFSTPKTSSNQNASNNGNSSNNGCGFSGIISRAKNMINPTSNLSAEKDYNGNVNPIRDVIPKTKENNQITVPKSDNKSISNENNNSKRNRAGNVFKAGAKATKGYLSIGAKMAEGNWNTNQNRNTNKIKSNMQHTEYINRVANSEESQKNLGDENGS